MLYLLENISRARDPCIPQLPEFLEADLPTGLSLRASFFTHLLRVISPNPSLPIAVQSLSRVLCGRDV